MTITKIVFSPTGGTERVADILANALGDKVVTVDLCDGHTVFSKAEMGDLAVIAMPLWSCATACSASFGKPSRGRHLCSGCGSVWQPCV